jgi:hypothetical protein
VYVPLFAREPRLMMTAASLFAARVGAVERRPEATRELRRVVIGPEMHEEQARLLVQHVTMKRSHIDAICPQRLDHGIHLIVGQDEVSSDGSSSAARRLKVDGYGNAHRTVRR